MKKLIPSLGFMVLLATSIQAQTDFGLKAGINFPSYSFADSENISDVQPRTSFHLTGYLDARIAPWLYLHPEVSLQGKGAKIIESQILGGAEVIQRTMWLDFPFNFLGKVPIGDVGNVFAGTGPYIGFSMNGENTYASGSTSAMIIYKDNAMKSVDYGINFLTGVKWSRFSLNVNYRLGLANITNSTYKWSDDIKNRVFSLGIGVSLL
ncbi:outer membrane beta-barrel protein [Parapedobacter sp. 10938]|uniref:outer membrane beta-barrel protein n=1 Tax=Parapedobacter flavus TaxID=3110225 RepID=UPI002DBF1C8D|nr:outer membrane beta-barrel protein [Parapedobacter sp. 10938]MEC3881199.1 outer membrane beta-barrel protein [Parapedobacter sp. 10938]